MRNTRIMCAVMLDTKVCVMTCCVPRVIECYSALLL